MKTRLRLTIIVVIALVGLLSIVALWQQSQEREKGIVVATLPHFEPGEIDGLTLTKGEKKLELSKDTKGWWLKNLNKQADSAKVLGLLTALQETQLGDLVAESSTRLEAYDIADNQGIVLTLSNGNKVIYQLVFGKRGKNGTVFVRLPNKNQVFRGIKAPLHELQLDELTWRNKQLFDFSPDQISQIVGQVDGSSYTIVRDGTSMAIASNVIDEHFRLDNNRAWALFRNLAMLKAVGFNDNPTAQIKETDCLFEIYTEKEMRRVIVGKANDQRQHEVMVEGVPEIFILPSSSIDQIHRSPELLRDLKMFNLTPEAVSALRLENDKPIALKRVESGDFILDGQTDEQFDSYNAQQVVRALVNLRASKVISLDNNYDFGPTSQTFALNDGSSWHQVILGEEHDGILPAKGDFPGVYGIAQVNIRRFGSGLEMFHRAPLSNKGGAINYEQLQNLPPEVQQQILQKIRQQQQ